MVLRKINEVNYVLQKSKKSKSFVTHVDKMKLCGDQSHDSWLAVPEVEGQGPGVASSVVVSRGRKRPARVRADEDGEEERLGRPRREVGRPSRVDGYV